MEESLAALGGGGDRTTEEKLKVADKLQLAQRLQAAPKLHLFGCFIWQVLWNLSCKIIYPVTYEIMYS